jgi:leucyl-tRNA synthetase
VAEHGADALRLYEMFMGPLEAVKPWQTDQLSGVVRFRDRVYNLAKGGSTDEDPHDEILRDMHKTVKKVTLDIEKMSFNTAISSLMIFTNALTRISGPKPKAAVEALVLLLSPFAPHVAEECWKELGHDNSIAFAAWPSYDNSLCIDTMVTMTVQVNGKVRATIDVEVDISEEHAMAIAVEHRSVQKFTAGSDIKRVIFVPGKVLNIVVSKRT